MWTAYDNLTRQAFADPGRDWTAELQKVAAGSPLDSAVASLTGMARASAKQTGFVDYELVEVTNALVDRVELVMCSDMSNFAAQYADGTPITADRSNPRLLVRTLIVRDEAGDIPWAVFEFDDLGTPC